MRIEHGLDVRHDRLLHRRTPSFLNGCVIVQIERGGVKCTPTAPRPTRARRPARYGHDLALGRDKTRAINREPTARLPPIATVVPPNTEDRHGTFSPHPPAH